MVDKEIEDFVVVVGDNVDSELEGYKLFGVKGQHMVKNKNVLLNLRAVDVPVRRSNGLALSNLLFGKATVVNKLDLDKVRQNISVPADLYVPVKLGGKPQVALVLPNDFDDLPEPVKTHPFLGDALKLAYMERHALTRQRELLMEAGLQETEILDKMAGSTTKFNEYIQSTIRQLSQDTKSLEADLNKRRKLGSESEEDSAKRNY